MTKRRRAKKLTQKYGTKRIVAPKSTALCPTIVMGSTVIMQAPSSSTNLGHLATARRKRKKATTGRKKI